MNNVSNWFNFRFGNEELREEFLTFMGKWVLPLYSTVGSYSYDISDTQARSVVNFATDSRRVKKEEERTYQANLKNRRKNGEIGRRQPKQLTDGANRETFTSLANKMSISSPNAKDASLQMAIFLQMHINSNGNFQKLIKDIKRYLHDTTIQGMDHEFIWYKRGWSTQARNS